MLISSLINNFLPFFFQSLIKFQFLNSGFPVWLHFVPGIVFRTDNEPFKVLKLTLLWISVLLFWYF